VPAVASSASSGGQSKERSAEGTADTTAAEPWAQELATMVEQGEQERARLTAQLEQEAARQAASLQERIADRKKAASQRLGSSRQGRRSSSGSSKSGSGSGLTPSMGSPTAHRGKSSAATSPTSEYRRSPRAPHSPNSLASATGGHYTVDGLTFVDPQRTSADSNAVSFSADWLQREWDSAQDDHAAQQATVGDERSRQRAATRELRLSRQGVRRGGSNSGDSSPLPCSNSRRLPPESPPAISSN
jgi:hypothetical protein